ncbi:MAG: anti-sigma factor [Gemmatimonadota bacterium]
MGHPDEGLMQALLDGEVGGAEADALRAHLKGCLECRAGAEALEEASRKTTRALFLVDTEPRFEDARSRVLAKSRQRGRKRPTAAGSSISLPRAASIALLLTGAVVTALPGSPVRRWMVQGWQALTESAQTDSGLQEPGGAGRDQGALPSGGGIPETGASIPSSTEGVEIWIHSLLPEAELRVVWTNGDEAWVHAGEGTRFNLVAGRLEAFSPPGSVRVEIPRNLEQVTLWLNGSVLLGKSGGEVEIVGPVQQRTPSEIIFEAPGSTNDGRS